MRAVSGQVVVVAAFLGGCALTRLPSEAAKDDGGEESRDSGEGLQPDGAVVADGGFLEAGAHDVGAADAGCVPNSVLDGCDGRDNDCNGVIDDGYCLVGCSDGEREGFVDQAAFPNIAGCAGGFQVPGVSLVRVPSCARQGGDDGFAPEGAGCNVSDLCQVGWRVCASAQDVESHSATGTCDGAVAEGDASLFFATRQSGPGVRTCDAMGTDDLFGCGNLGAAPDTSCAPLDRFSDNLCEGLSDPWACGTDGKEEAASVVKAGAGAGGVLCCRERSRRFCRAFGPVRVGRCPRVRVLRSRARA